MQSNRRQFLKSSAATAAAVSTPQLWMPRPGRAGDANNRPRCLAIGVGGSRGRFNRGGTIARQAAQFADLIAICDVDELHAKEFSEKLGGKPKTYFDYREALAAEKPDIVTIGTPDHWHVPIAVAAMRAGCDVYCEKPLHGHMANFFDCLEDRSQPVADVFTHHRTMTSCHLCNVTLMLGRPVKWAPNKEAFIGDDQAAALMQRPSRKDCL